MAIYICAKCTGPLKPVNRFFNNHYVCERCLQKYDSRKESKGPIQLIIKISFVAFLMAMLSDTKTFFTEPHTGLTFAIKISLGIFLAAFLYSLQSKYSTMRFTPIEDTPSIYTRRDLKIILTIAAVTGILLFILLQI